MKTKEKSSDTKLQHKRLIITMSIELSEGFKRQQIARIQE